MASGEALVLAMSVVVVGGLSVAIVPRAIEGATRGDQGRAPVEPEGVVEREVYERVRLLFETSVGVLGVWARGERGGVEIGLWQRDVRDPGVVDSDEVVLLSYSPVLGGLAAYVEGSGAPDPGIEGLVVEGEAGPARGTALGREDLLRDAFPAWWRERPGIERHVIAGGLSDVRVVPLGESKGLETLRVELLWGVASSDVGVEKGAFEVALRRLDVGP